MNRVVIRRRGALARLEAQLHEGVKPVKLFGPLSEIRALTSADRERITNEIETLKGRIY